MALTQPKKPVGGAYGVFANEKRAEFQKVCTGQKASAVSKMAGEEWKKLSDAEKATYQSRYESVKAQFEKDMAAFLENGGEKSKGVRALRSEKKAIKEGTVKKVRDAEAPKKPTGGAYGFFLAEQREDIKKTLPANHKITDVTKKAGELWKSLPESDKHKYEDMYKTAKEKYDAEMAAYRENKKAEEPAEEEPGPKGSNKRPASDQSATKAKRPRPVATPMSAGQSGVQLNEEILGKARTAGVESQLRNLANRPEVVASAKPAEDLLKALQEAKGLVNAAKRLLCEA